MSFRQSGCLKAAIRYLPLTMFALPFYDTLRLGRMPSQSQNPASENNPRRSVLRISRRFPVFYPTSRSMHHPRNPKVFLGQDFLLDLDKSELRSVYTSLIVASKIGFFIVDICKTSHPFPSK
jgi:hypothetical protein